MSTKTPEDLSEIQNLTLDELRDALTGLDAEDLATLKALEQADSKPRAGALEAIDAAIAKLPVAPAATAKPATEDEAKPAAGKAAWQTDDYTGPLTIDQATWRRHNVKPVGGAATK